VRIQVAWWRIVILLAPWGERLPGNSHDAGMNCLMAEVGRFDRSSAAWGTLEVPALPQSSLRLAQVALRASSQSPIPPREQRMSTTCCYVRGDMYGPGVMKMRTQ
jgi:hypothetical protein